MNQGCDTNWKADAAAGSGATSITLTDLASDTLYFVTVRASDALGNVETNAAVATATTHAFDPLTGVEALTAGEAHTCAIMMSGAARCWGSNYYGQLGDGTTTDRRTPVEVTGLADVDSISGGIRHTCAALGDGTARCWGVNYFGQLGDGTTTDRTTPTPVTGLTDAVAISAGADHTCALLEDGRVSCWGKNDDGQLGDGTTVDRHVPVIVPGLSNVRAISVGGLGGHTCAVLEDGSVRCWGRNGSGQLGDGTTTTRLTPVEVPGITSATAVTTSAWSDTTCVLLQGGDAKCWGENGQGQLGDRTTTSRLSPVDVSGITSATAISLGGNHACAVSETSTMMCWGSNESGQLGDHTTDTRLAATPVPDMSGAVNVASGGAHTCALTSESTLACWGYGAAGQLGNDHTSTSYEPTTVVQP